MNRFIGRLMLWVVALFILGYAGFQVWRMVNVEYEVMPAIETPISVEITAKGVAIRRETVLYSVESENISYLYPDGTHVSTGMPVAQAVSGRSDITNRMIADELRRELESLESLAAPGETVILQADSVSQRVYSDIDTIAAAAALGDLTPAQDLKYDILEQLNRRSATIDRETDFSGRIEELERRISALGVDSQEAMRGAITAPEPGYFTKSVDGYEYALNPDVIDELSVEDFVSYINSSAPPDVTLGASNPKDGAGRLITDHIWYFAAAVSSADAARFREGRKVELDFGLVSQKPFLARVDRIIREETGARAVIIFECDAMSEELSNLRAHKVDISLSEVVGYKFPIECKRFIGTQLGVYVLDTTVINFKPVEIIYEDEKSGYVIFSTTYQTDWAKPGSTNKRLLGLERYDQVIIGGKGLEDGKVLE